MMLSKRGMPLDYDELQKLVEDRPSEALLDYDSVLTPAQLD